MVQLIINNPAGETLSCFSLPGNATVQQLLLKLIDIQPELAQAQAIRNDACHVTYRLANASTAQTLVQAGLVRQDAAAETLVVLMKADTSCGASVATAAVPPSKQDAEARILELFASSSASPSAKGTSTPAAAVPSTLTTMGEGTVEQPHAHVGPITMDVQELELQRRIYARIQQQQIDENLANALEYTPEAFAPVTMLYIPCTINQVPIKAFVDSGAQNSIMNKRTAERCGLMRLVDVRMRGVAVGVGRQEICGRIHMAPVSIAGMHIPFAFYVIEDQVIDLIIGLDQLKRHEMLIDLKKNCLTIGSVHVPFLEDKDVPLSEALEKERAKSRAEEDDPTHPERRHRDAIATTTTTTTTTSAAGVASGPAAVVPGATRNASAPAVAPVLSEMERQTRLEGFMSFSGITDPARAAELLELAGWDPDGAAELFFDS